MPNACAGITARCFQHSPANSSHSHSHFWFVSCHLKHKQRWGARDEKWGGGGTGCREDEEVSSETQLFLLLPTRLGTFLSHSLVRGARPHPSWLTEKRCWKAASQDAPGYFSQHRKFGLYFIAPAIFKPSQSKMILQQHMEKDNGLTMSAAHRQLARY